MFTLPLHARHDRLFETNRFVYPVLSRRSGGLSLGVNLNPDKICNFDCIYCQVDRTTQAETEFVEIDALLSELEATLRLITSGEIYTCEKFRDTPAARRRLNDIAFSGDGEPTTYRNFDEIITRSAEVKRRLGLDEVKMVLITNASMLHREHVRRGLAVLDANQGEIWAKLDAGTEAYYQIIERTPIPFSQILKNITDAAQIRALVIQSLFMRVHDEPPSSSEIDAFCDRLREITMAGGNIALVQIYTVVRPPAEEIVSSLQDQEVDALVEQVRQRTGLSTVGYYGANSSS